MVCNFHFASSYLIDDSSLKRDVFCHKEEVYQDTDISNRISDQVVQCEADNIHLNTITIDSHYHTRNQNNSSASLDALWKASCGSKRGQDCLV